MAEIAAGDDISKSEIVQDHNFCAICGSLFKFTSQADFDSEIVLVSESYLTLADPVLVISIWLPQQARSSRFIIPSAI